MIYSVRRLVQSLCVEKHITGKIFLGDAEGNKERIYILIGRLSTSVMLLSTQRDGDGGILQLRIVLGVSVTVV